VSKKQKLIARFKKNPKDFTWDELVTMLVYLGFIEEKLGKTSGSRAMFMNQEGVTIRTHKPHPAKIIKGYVIKEIIEILERNQKI
jgi:hypothetical protein